MPDQNLIIYKISCEGTLEKIETPKLLEAFTSIDALAIYNYAMKRLYVWKGEHLDLIVGKYVPEAKDLILKADRNIRILRHIVVESGTEPQDFFDDLDLQPDALKAQLEKTEKIYDGLTEEMEKLKIVEHELYVKDNYDQALEKAQKLLKLGSKLNKLAVIKEQQYFIKAVEETKGLKEKLDKEFSEVVTLIEKSAFEEAWSKLDKISSIAVTKKLPDVQVRVSRLRESIKPNYKVEAEQRRKAEALEAQKKVEEEEARKKAAEEETKKLAAEQEAKKLAAEEEARKKEAEDEAKRLAAEEEARKKAAAEESIAKKLQYAEENFQVAFGDRKYSECLQNIPEITQLASQLNKPEIVEKYKTLQKQIEENIQREAKIQAEQKEKSEKINQLKKSAADLESASKFPEAKAKYNDVKKLATEINDPLTVSFCEQRIAQIDAWAKELSASDLGKWDIAPFRIINRLRYNYVEVTTDKAVAQKRVSEIAAQSGKDADVKSVTMVRSKFKGQGPYNEKGECCALYIRKAEK